ncbi:MAG: hypothetical protein QM764_14035 [Chitinophagaceae bacterium]
MNKRYYMLKQVVLVVSICAGLQGMGQDWGIDKSRTETRDNAGLQGDAGAQSGFFQTVTPVNYPTGASSWWHLLDVRHSNKTNNYAMQFAGSFFDQNLWFRKTNSSSTQAWSRVITETNSVVSIGTGTGAAGTLKLADEQNIYNNYLIASLASANYRSGMMLQSSGSVSMAINGNPASPFCFRWLTAPNATTNYYDDTQEKMRLTMDGNLGIGTTSPVNKFQVNGNAMIGDGVDPISYGMLQLVRPASFSDSKLYLSFVRNGNMVNGIGYAPNSNVFGIWKWNNSGTPALAISEADNIGIGTSTPGTYKLAVEGTIGARKIKVTTSSFADYVFDKDYRLRTLEEVEKYIKVNNHLPEMPTACEVEKDGLDIGDNQVLLVKKIEELTLYVIGLNKKIEEQSEEIKRLKNK